MADEPRRVRTQAERDADGQAWRPAADHPWQEYNAHGNTRHHPGCTFTEDEHAPRPLASGGIITGPRRGDDRIPFVPAGCHGIGLTLPKPPPDTSWLRTTDPRRRWWHRLTRRNP